MIDWNKIKEKWPKSYNKIIKDLCLTYDDFTNKLYFSTLYELYEYKHWICFCDLVDFFDSWGIIIYITYFNNDTIGNFFCMYDYRICNAETAENYYSSEGIINRNDAKIQAVYKAFEILEKQLEGKR